MNLPKSGNQHESDTIAAIATPPGCGGIGIVRISGPGVHEIAQKVLSVKQLIPRQAIPTHFLDQEKVPIDEGLAIFFPRPKSFTGEDVLELHGHGGIVIMDMLLSRIIQTGARLARPGEFSERAFLNGKIDLIQAESIADLINAANQQAVRSAVRSLQGLFSIRIKELMDAITEIRTFIEAALDFPDEDIDFLSDSTLLKKLEACYTLSEKTMNSAKQGVMLQEGMKIVILGPPNVGKSTLLNSLCQREVAIVTDIPGTTRDILSERISIDGIPITILDTAGLRDTNEVVEVAGIVRAKSVAKSADHIFMVTDIEDGCSEEKRGELRSLIDLDWESARVTWIENKIDKKDLAPSKKQLSTHEWIIQLSAKTGAGIDLLKAHLKGGLGVAKETEFEFMARRRHIVALEKCVMNLQTATEQLVLKRNGELVAEELRLAQQALGEVLGAVSTEELLGRIFEQFCIGK